MQVCGSDKSLKRTAIVADSDRVNAAVNSS
jgi:hypothetical protein